MLPFILWILASIVIAVALLFYREVCFGTKVRATTPGGICPECRYSLTGLAESGICPECGHAYANQQGHKAIWNWSFSRRQVAMLIVAFLFGLLGRIPELIVTALAYLGPGQKMAISNWEDVILVEAQGRDHPSPWVMVLWCAILWLPLARVATRRQLLAMVLFPIVGTYCVMIAFAMSKQSWNQGVYVGFREGTSVWRWSAFGLVWVGLLLVNGRDWYRKMAALVWN